MLKEYQSYKGEYLNTGEVHINNKCVKHINKKSKYYVKLNDGIKAGVCSECAVVFAQQSIKVNKLNDDHLDSRMD